MNSSVISRQRTSVIEFGYNGDISTYSVKNILCLFNWIDIYQAFTATLEFFDLYRVGIYRRISTVLAYLPIFITFIRPAGTVVLDGLIFYC